MQKHQTLRSFLSVVTVAGVFFGSASITQGDENPFPIAEKRYCEDFESKDPLQEWVTFPVSKDHNWKLAHNVSADGIGHGSLGYNNYENYLDDPQYQYRGIRLPLMSFKGTTETYLSFDVAMSQLTGTTNQTCKEGSGNGFDNQLRLYYKYIPKKGASTKGASNWTEIGSWCGQTLQTAPSSSKEFLPEPNQWKSIKIPLKDVNGIENVKLAVEVSQQDFGQIYIDNICVYTPEHQP